MATMATFKAGRHAFNVLTAEKPHSSITDWVEILSGDKYAVDDYEGIPELVESVNILGVEGATEASRALRKKLKYGNVHRQLRALTILKALVENCAETFRYHFLNSQLADRIKLMAADPMTDESVKRRLLAVLAGWHRLFKDDAKMSAVANLYTACGGGKQQKRASVHIPTTPTSPRRSTPSPPPSQTLWEQHQRMAEEEARLRQERKRAEREAKEAEKRREKVEKEERMKKAEEDRLKRLKESAAAQKAGPKVKRAPFDFEKEKPQILTSIAAASQASNNLVNALKLVNREKETVQANPRVQDCLAKAKLARKAVIRYIQLTDNEEVIGTLLETNERIIASIQLYDQMSKSAEHDSDSETERAIAASESASASAAASIPHPAVHPVEAARARLARSTLSPAASITELDKLQIKQRERVQRAASQRGPDIYADLRDLSFGAPLTSTTRAALPSPIRPTADSDEEREGYGLGGSLSDYSDYSSDDEPRNRNHASGSGAGNRAYQNVVPDRETSAARAGLLIDLDPFADPDEGAEVGTPGIQDKKVLWAH